MTTPENRETQEARALTGPQQFRKKLLAIQDLNAGGNKYVTGLCDSFLEAHPRYRRIIRLGEGFYGPTYILPQDDELLLLMSTQYKERKRTEFAERDLKKKLEKEFKAGQDRILDAVASDRFPQLSDADVRDKFVQTSIVVVDELTAWTRHAKRYGPRMSAKVIPQQYSWTVSDGTRQRIYVDERTPETLYPYIMQHEPLHVLDGQTYPGNPEHPVPSTFVATQPGFVFPEDLLRSGLCFRTVDTKHHFLKESIFGWLHEGLIHDIAIELLQDSDAGMGLYAAEHEYYLFLHERGDIAKNLFEDAWLENYGPEGLPSWRKLYGKICDAFASGFLEALDASIRAKEEEDSNFVAKLFNAPDPLVIIPFRKQ